MSTGQPLFQLRREVTASVSLPENEDTADHSSVINENCASEYLSSTMDLSFDNHQNHQKFNNMKILTENEKYIVKRLTPDLSTLPTSLDNPQLEGLVDTQSGKALVNDVDNLYIWDYHSNQRDTNFYRIPLHEEHAVLNTPPKCLFTWPAAMDDTTKMFLDNSSSSSGGVCIIHRKNSRFVYYEDIDSINNLHLQLSKGKAHILDLKLKDNEMVTLALNCEPAGIIIATSFGRLLFVTIRDSTGRTNLQLKQQLIKAQRGFLFHSFKASKEITSIKLGPIVGRGERLLYVVTKGGDFQTWHLSVGTNSFRRIEINLFEQILESLQDLYPFAHGTLQILDSHPLFPDSSSAHLILSCITNDKETYYILTTIILDEKTTSFTIFSTYRLNTYILPFYDLKPKLFVPDCLSDSVKPITTVFLLFYNAVVLTQVNSNLDSSYPLRRKWEDIISFRDDIRIIGSGYNSDSLYILSKEMGVLELSIVEKENSEEIEEIRFVKSHIDQAVYFSKISSNPIEFNLPKEISLENEEIEDDLNLSSNEIFHSTGKYIPPILNTLLQHLNLRVELYKNLLQFVERNFNYKIYPYSKLELLEKFEIMNCCLKFCGILQTSDQLTEIWQRVLSTCMGDLSMETLVVNQLDKFPQLFTQFLHEVTGNSLPSRSLDFKSQVVTLLTSCLYEATLEEGEKALRYEQFQLDPLEMNASLPWFINIDILNSINELFFDYKSSLKMTSEENNRQLLVLIKILYYSFSQANLWFNEEHERKSMNPYLEIQDIYEKNHLSWNVVLCQLNLQESSLQIAEFYHDLKAIVATLETLDSDISQELYHHYFEKFGYEFAATLFDHYIKQKNLKDLFYRFPEQHEYMVKFFENSEQHGNVAWIQKIFDKQYDKASETLCRISLGETGTGLPIEDRQLYLSIAKLSALAEDDEKIPAETLTRIQADLDILEGQQDLFHKLEKENVKISPIFVNSELGVVFKKLREEIKSGKSLPIQNIIELYTMLQGSEGFYCALKLLAFDGEVLDYERKTFLTTMVWRRCILAEDDWSKVTDITESSLYKVLCRFFQEQLYESNCPLPSYSLITDRSLLTKEYLNSAYLPFSDDIEGLKNCFEREYQSVEQLGKDFDTRIKSIIGSANESTGSKCVVNYESNTVEF